MPEIKKLSRREFLKDAGVIVGGVALAATALESACTTTKTMTQTATVTTKMTTTLPPVTTTASATVPPPADTFLFLNAVEANTLKAISGRLIPGSATDPGAVEAKAYLYIDHALGGYYIAQQAAYRQGLAALNAYSNSKNGKNFADLTTAQQDALLTDMQNGTATGFTASTPQAFFATLQQHVREGTFCDPIYGGNFNLVGWKMIGFPGAQEAYGDTQMAIGFDQASLRLMTLTEEEAIPMPLPDNGF